MIDLPRSIAPLAPHLSLFPDDVAESLGGLVMRLSVAIGPLRGTQREPSGDPDGFDGLARRGSYERLLLTEWLLADELSDEFLRRAASGEHAFLRLAERGPKATNVSVALFDVGPSQLGGPRVAHLAALVVLARRAAAAGAQFLFGALQSSDAPLADVTPEAVRAMLAARTSREPTARDVTAWKARVDATAAGEVVAPEVWVVGGAKARVLALEQQMSSVLLEDALSFEGRELSVDVADARSPRRTVTLELPQPNEVVRLLRDPFRTRTPELVDAKAALAPTTNLVFSDNGTKLYLRTGQGVVILPVPNSPRAGVGHPKFLQAPRPIAAVGRVGKQNAVVTGDEASRKLLLSARGKTIHTLGHFTTEPKVHAPWEPSADEPLRPLHWRRGKNKRWRGWYVDGRGWLFQFDNDDAGDGARRLVARDVVASSPLHDGFSCIGRLTAMEPDDPPCKLAPWLSGDQATWQPGDWALTHSFADRDEREHVLLGRGDLAGAFLALPGRMRAGAIVAFGRGAGSWLLWRDQTQELITLPADHKPFGIGTRGKSLGLFTIDPNGRDIRLFVEETSHLVCTAADVIQSAQVSDEGHAIGYLTANAEASVYSVTEKALLCRFQLGDRT